MPLMPLSIGSNEEQEKGRDEVAGGRTAKKTAMLRVEAGSAHLPCVQHCQDLTQTVRRS